MHRGSQGPYTGDCGGFGMCAMSVGLGTLSPDMPICISDIQLYIHV